MSGRDGLLSHLASGATTTCQCWSVTRRDGVVLGFTEHDRDLSFDGVTFRAASGLTAKALHQTNGLSVDNSEAMGALSSASVTEADLMAGRYDGAEVRSWLVNWASVADRMQLFRGYFGEVVRSAGAFRAELRGLAEVLNQPQGMTYQRSCSAVLGDAKCAFDVNKLGYVVETAIVGIEADGVYRIAAQPAIAEGWFQRGRARMIGGPAAGLVGLVKFDAADGVTRRVELWVDFPVAPVVGNILRLEAGCDKLATTCREKFGNFMNFRGFPHIPGEDWMTSYPVSGGRNDGESLFR